MYQERISVYNYTYLLKCQPILFFSDSNIYMSNADYNQSDVSINGNLPLFNLGFWYGAMFFSQ